MDSRIFTAPSDPRPLGLEPAMLLHPAIVHLWQSFRLAQSVSREDPTRCQWEFAVEAAQLRHFGLGDTQLRWLILRGYIQHREAHQPPIQPKHNGHAPSPRLLFDDSALLCLTPAGADLIDSLNTALQNGGQSTIAPTAYTAVAPSDNGNGHHVRFDRLAVPTIAPNTVINHDLGKQQTPLLPTWDAERRELHFGGQLVKQFKWPAFNQEAILAAFQEENWPPRIDDPLSPSPEIAPKRRLHDTIKCLNRNHHSHLIHFRGDGTGEGILWEAFDD